MWRVLEDDAVFSLLERAAAFKRAPGPRCFDAIDEAFETIARAYHSFLSDYMVDHYGLAKGSGFEEIVAAFRRHQAVRFDLLSAGWWACLLRSRPGQGVARFPSRGPHPQVDVYVSHLRWLRARALGEEGTKASAWGGTGNSLEALIRAWKVSGYGCRIQ